MEDFSTTSPRTGLGLGIASMVSLIMKNHIPTHNLLVIPDTFYANEEGIQQVPGTTPTFAPINSSTTRKTQQSWKRRSPGQRGARPAGSSREKSRRSCMSRSCSFGRIAVFRILSRRKCSSKKRTGLAMPVCSRPDSRSLFSVTGRLQMQKMKKAVRDGRFSGYGFSFPQRRRVHRKQKYVFNACL